MVIGVKVNPFSNVPISAGVHLPPEFNNGIDFEANRYIVDNQLVPVGTVLTESRTSSAHTLNSDGVYTEAGAGELALGRGVGLNTSEEVVNLRDNSIQNGVVLGVHGGVGEIPDGWSLTKLGGGLTYEIVEITTLKGLPSFKLRVTGTASGSAQLYLRHGGATVGSIPATQGEFYAFNFIARLAAGSVSGISQAWMDNAIWDAGGVFQSRPTPNWREEFHVTNLDAVARRYSVWVELEDEDTAYVDPTINVKFIDGQVIDATFEFACFNATAGAEERPPVLGAGSGATRAADNPVVVQGLGQEIIPFPTFSSLAGWVFGGSEVDTTPGSLKVTNLIAAEGNATLVPAIPIIAGVLYAITFTLDELSGAGGGFEVAGQRISSGGVVGIEKTLYVVAGGAGNHIRAITNSGNAGAYVVFSSIEVSQVLAYPHYNPDSQAYAETLTQVMANPTFAGTLGARPDDYSNVGPIYVVKVLEQETVGGVACNPVAFRRLNPSGYEGIKSLPEAPLPAGEHLVTYYIRAVGGVTVANSFSILAGSGTPSLLVLEDKTALEGLTPGVWYKRVKTVTLTAASNYAGIVATSGEAGTGYDIALFNVVLNTTQDVETQTERGAFSRILEGEGFASTVFPSAKDLVVGGGFDTQEDVDLWTGVNGGALTLSGGAMRVTNTAVNNGGGYRLVHGLRDGGVFRYSGERVADNDPGGNDYHLGSVEGYGTYAENKKYSDGPRYFIKTVSGELRLYTLLNGTAIGTWREHDNISLQEVEPGVVIEAVGVWGDAGAQHVLRLDDTSNANTFILIARTSDGRIRLKIETDDVTLYDIVSATDWPDDTEAAFRLELTNTDGGCFASVFLDDVFVIGSDAFVYPQSINQLGLSPVAGVELVKQVYYK